MSLEGLSSQIQELFAELDEATKSFTRKTNISCKPGCGACCMKPNAVWASVGEMLPMAMKLLAATEVNDVLAKLNQVGDESPCVMFEPHDAKRGMGTCSAYLQRPTVCRLFGSSLRLAKQAKKEVLACAWQREEFAFEIEAAEKTSDRSLSPLAHHWTTRIHSACPEAYLQQEFPINRALKEAVLVVATRFCYNEDRCSLESRT